MTAGINFISKEAVDPLNGESLLEYEDNKEGLNKIIGGYQSCDNCYHLLIVIAEETADIYQNEHILVFFGIF